MHREMLWEFLYDEPGWQREDRAHVIATFRGGAKTTWFSFIVPIYISCLNNFGIYVGDYKLPPLDYIVLKSKTSKASQKNLYNIQAALNKPELVSIFGNLRPTISEERKKEGKDTSTLMILANGVIIEALGINQQIRGTNILGKRPKAVIYDDPETTENTKTEERRKNNEMDLLDETWGAVDERVGRIVYIGNMVHEDCLLKKLLQNDFWKKKFYTLTYKDPLTGEEKITWEKKYTWSIIERIKKFYESHPKLGLVAFYRNYYNTNKTDVNPVIQKLDVQYIHHNGKNWLRYKLDNKIIVERAYITVGYDAAVTQRASGSKTSILVLAQTASRKKFILEYAYGIFDVHDRYIEGLSESERPSVMAVQPDELAKVWKRGGIEESVRMIIKYNADGFAMGTEGQQLGFYSDIVDICARMNIRCTMFPISTAGRDSSNKIVRLKDWVLRQFENRVFYLNGDMFELVAEIESFPQSKLDILDSLYYADQAQVLPNNSIFKEDEDVDELEGIVIPKISAEESWVIA